MNDSIPNLIRRALTLHHEGRRVVCCLVVRSRGSTPQSAGALMLVDDAGQTYGTIGGGCVEAEVRRRAYECLLANRSGLMTFKLDHDYGWDDGLICGGTLDVVVAPAPHPDQISATLREHANRRPTAMVFELEAEAGPSACALRLHPSERLYIAGAGHVGQSVARLGLALEFDVSVFDDRGDLMERFLPQGVTRVPGDIADQLSAAPIDSDTFCVIVTRGHKHDEQALAAVLSRGARYIGMIGSRRKVKLIKDDLVARGCSRDDLDAVHAPIGLPIGSVLVEEIGVSIAAQLVEVRRKSPRPCVEGPALLPTLERGAVVTP